MEQFSFSFLFSFLNENVLEPTQSGGGSEPCVNTVNLADETVDLSLAMVALVLSCHM